MEAIVVLPLILFAVLASLYVRLADALSRELMGRGVRWGDLLDPRASCDPASHDFSGLSDQDLGFELLNEYARWEKLGRKPGPRVEARMLAVYREAISRGWVGVDGRVNFTENHKEAQDATTPE